MEIKPIGVVHSCFKEKFGAPRQAGLVESATAQIEVIPPYNKPEAFEGLEQFSHIWVLFCFHQNLRQEWRPKVRPPRLGGNQKMGVFATRSSFRPNAIGMSAVKLERITSTNDKLLIHISGQDFIDQTPIIDIKPYIRYADAIPEAQSGFADTPPQALLSVQFDQSCLPILNTQEKHLKKTIENILALDPRPAYRKETEAERIYGMKIENFDVKFRVKGKQAVVTEIIETK
jgi:tRNA-Thr(GGU) m(6)t(6)A37 methyltransferase TsaA